MLKTRWLIIVAVAAGTAGFAWHASLPAPLGPAEGAVLEGEVRQNAAAPSGDKNTLRVATFNIHGCKGLDGRRDVDRIAGCLDNLDFIALNEVHGARPGQPSDQAEQLGRQMGLAWLFAPCVRTWHCLDSGNGLLSRLPASSWRRIALARHNDRGHRNAVLVGVRHRDRTVQVLLTHVMRRDQRGRQEQLREVIARYLALAEPAILLGDLNSDADDPQIRALLAAPGVHDPVGEVLGSQAPRRIDWIIARGLRAVDAGMCDQGASDHPLVWAELEYTE